MVKQYDTVIENSINTYNADKRPKFPVYIKNSKKEIKKTLLAQKNIQKGQKCDHQTRLPKKRAQRNIDVKL